MQQVTNIKRNKIWNNIHVKLQKSYHIQNHQTNKLEYVNQEQVNKNIQKVETYVFNSVKIATGK